MAVSIDNLTAAPARRAARAAATLRVHPPIVAILSLAAALNVFRLDRAGYGNLYYAAGVRSMPASWHNFFFVAFDPAGFVSIDKPPLGLWVQVLSARLFGFSGVSLLLPQALAGVLSVWLLYRLVRGPFGEGAGLLAALLLAISPINVVTNRNNTMDSLLVCLLLAAALATVRAARPGQQRRLLVAAVLLGLAFNVKLTAAWLVLPALVAAFYLASPLSRRARIGWLALAAVVMLSISFAWITTVDVVPPGARPYVGGSNDNRELELVFWHNGLSRLVGPNGQELVELGPPGVTRLFNRQLGGQAGWWLPLAVAGAVVAWGRPSRRIRPPLDERRQAIVLWVLWMLPQAVFYSSATFFHPYYMVELVPGIVALVAIGVASVSPAGRASWRGWLLGSAVVATALFHARLLTSWDGWGHRLAVIVVMSCGMAAIVWIVARAAGEPATSKPVRFATVAAGAALLAGPLVWAILPIRSPEETMFPMAGPGSPFGWEEDIDPRALALLGEQQGSTRFLLATVNAEDAAPYIVATGRPVMALGGFSGRDEIIGIDRLTELIAQGQVRFFLLPGLDPPEVSGGTNVTSQDIAWLWAHCSPVAPTLWHSESAPLAQTLLDCQTAGTTGQATGESNPR